MQSQNKSFSNLSAPLQTFLPTYLFMPACGISAGKTVSIFSYYLGTGENHCELFFPSSIPSCVLIIYLLHWSGLHLPVKEKVAALKPEASEHWSVLCKRLFIPSSAIKFFFDRVGEDSCHYGTSSIIFAPKVLAHSLGQDTRNQCSTYGWHCRLISLKLDCSSLVMNPWEKAEWK